MLKTWFRALVLRLHHTSWTIHIIPKKREASVHHFTAMDALRISMLGIFAIAAVFGYFLLRGPEEQSALLVLSKNLQSKEAQLENVETQNQRMKNLLSQKAERLEENLFRMRVEEAEIRKLLEGHRRAGMLPGKQVAFELYRFRRFASRSSRGGSYDQLVLRLAALERQISKEEPILDRSRQLAIIEHAKLEAGFTRVPTEWPVLGEVTSPFGYRVHPIDGEGEFHPGLDIATDYGSPIRAAGGGVCVFAEYKSGFGYTVMIDHRNGLISQYSHCSRLTAFEGASIQKGEIIAHVGSTGYSTGPHVHYELHYHDTPIDPTPFLGLTEEELADRGGISGLLSKR